MHKAKKIGIQEYEYRGFRVHQDAHRGRWQIMIGDVHGWLAAANTLRSAKERIDYWFFAVANEHKLCDRIADAVAVVSREPSNV